MNEWTIKYNSRTKEMCEKLGFEYREDEDERAIHPKFLDIEKIKFAGKWAYENYVDIGRTPNGQWAYGSFFIFGGAGGASGLNIFNVEYFTSRKEALIAGIENMRKQHKESIAKAPDDHCGNYDTKLNRKVIAECDTLLSVLKYGEQLELF